MDGTFEIILETLNISLKLLMASVDSAMNRRLRIAFSFLRHQTLPICIAFARPSNLNSFLYTNFLIMPIFFQG